jgi:hypothetical protein
MTAHDRSLCAALAGLLRAVRVVAAWGFALTCIAALVLGVALPMLSMTSTMGFGAVTLLGVLERYFALRLVFDADLFEALARGSIDTLPALDAALLRLGLRRAPDAPRSLEERIHGTRALMQRHGIVVACQSAMFLLALLTQDLR